MEDGPGIMFIIFILAFAVLIYAAFWRIFEKAGRPGWAAIIPIYNMYVLAQIAGKPGWWVILMIIPLVNIVIIFLVYHGLSKNFGKDIGFTLGLVFLSFIFIPILGFGDAEYLGGDGVHPGEEGILDSEIV